MACTDAAFAEDHGSKPRILVAKVGQDGHDRGQKVIASAFADLGFDGLGRRALRHAGRGGGAQAVAEGIHIVGVSSLAAGHLTLVPEIRAALDAAGRSDILLVVGGVIPPGDYEAVRAAGVAAIFPPGTVIAEAAEALLTALNERFGYAQKDPAAYAGRCGVIGRLNHVAIVVPGSRRPRSGPMPRGSARRSRSPGTCRSTASGSSS